MLAPMGACLLRALGRTAARDASEDLETARDADAATGTPGICAAILNLCQ